MASVGNRGVQVGDYVTPGKRLAAVVPLDKVFVDANFKETQLPPIVAGQTATVKVDALNGEALTGTVESVAPASGSQFSLLPPGERDRQLHQDRATRPGAYRHPGIRGERPFAPWPLRCRQR